MTYKPSNLVQIVIFHLQQRKLPKELNCIPRPRNIAPKMNFEDPTLSNHLRIKHYEYNSSNNNNNSSSNNNNHVVQKLIIIIIKQSTSYPNMFLIILLISPDSGSYSSSANLLAGLFLGRYSCDIGRDGICLRICGLWIC